MRIEELRLLPPDPQVRPVPDRTRPRRFRAHLGSPVDSSSWGLYNLCLDVRPRERTTRGRAAEEQMVVPGRGARSGMNMGAGRSTKSKRRARRGEWTFQLFPRTSAPSTGLFSLSDSGEWFCPKPQLAGEFGYQDLEVFNFRTAPSSAPARGFSAAFRELICELSLSPLIEG